MSDIDYSIIVPHYNDLPGLKACLDSLERQTLARARYEIIVGDNRSPCGLAAVEAAVAGRARVVEVPERGAGPARNGGAALARGSVLAFIDSDCIAEPGWLAGGVAAVTSGRFAGGRVTVALPTGRRLTGAEAYEAVFAFHNEDYVRRKGFTVTANLFVTAADFRKVGPFRVGVSEDMEWCRRATAAGLELVYAADAVVAHPPRPDWPSLLKKIARTQREMFELERERPRGRLRWLARSCAMPLTILPYAGKALRSDRIAGARVAAVATLARLRLWRFAAGVRQAATGRP